MTRNAVTRIVMVAAACAGLLGAAWAEARSAQRKLDAIGNQRQRAGARVAFTRGEIKSWIDERAGLLASYGVRDLRVALETGRLTGSARIDFLKLRQTAAGADTAGWIGKNLLGGERPVTASLRIESRSGKARVDVERVEIAGVPIEGPVLDFLIRSYVNPTFPSLKMDEWFDLDSRIKRIAVAPNGVSVYF